MRSSLVRIAIGKPAWLPLFVEYAAANPADAHAVSDLFQELQRQGVSVSDVSRVLLTNTLGARNQVESAWNYYRSFHPAVDPARSRDPRFLASSLDTTLFDWQPVAQNGLNASLQRGPGGGSLAFSAPAGAGGVLARQVQLLPPGRYRMVGHSLDVEQAIEDAPFWQLSCGNGREIWRFDIPNSAVGDGNFSGDLTVPIGCAGQTLTLNARPSDKVGGLAGQIDLFSITPLP